MTAMTTVSTFPALPALPALPAFSALSLALVAAQTQAGDGAHVPDYAQPSIRSKKRLQARSVWSALPEQIPVASHDAQGVSKTE
jgi:hypothetical protein